MAQIIIVDGDRWSVVDKISGFQTEIVIPPEIIRLLKETARDYARLMQADHAGDDFTLIPMIRYLTTYYNIGLKDAKDIVDHYIKHRTIP